MTDRMTLEPCCDHTQIPESIFACKCPCHNWEGFVGPSMSALIDNIPNGLHLTYPELIALTRALETQYLAYDDEELHNVVNKIFKVVRGAENK